MKNKILASLLFIMVLCLFCFILYLYFDSKEVDGRNKKLLYEVYYNGLDCPTPHLKLYDNNTYELYDSFDIEGKSMISKIGNFSYDINLILENINKYEVYESDSYIIMDNKGNIYKASSNNKDLSALLEKIDVNLVTCLGQE